MKKYTPQEIKEIRGKLGITQKELADEIGVSKRTVESWESGKRSPSNTACRIIEMVWGNETLHNERG